MVDSIAICTESTNDACRDSVILNEGLRLAACTVQEPKYSTLMARTPSTATVSILSPTSLIFDISKSRFAVSIRRNIHVGSIHVYKVVLYLLSRTNGRSAAHLDRPAAPGTEDALV